MLTVIFEILLTGIAVGFVVDLLADILPSLGRTDGHGHDNDQDKLPHLSLYWPYWPGKRKKSPALRTYLVILSSIALTGIVHSEALAGVHPPLVGERPLWLIGLYLAVFLLIVVVDIEHRRVLNIILFPTTVIGLIYASSLSPAMLNASIIGGCVGFLTFLFISLLRPGAMGMGDVKLAGMIGVLTGFPSILPALVIGIIAGGVGALALIVTRRTRFGGTMAYAPYLVFGATITLLQGANLLQLMLH